MNTYKSYKERYTSKLRKIALVFLLIQITELICPLSTYALTSGPSQPEVQGFEPVGTSEVVDLFSGDFTYNIPLFELPGSEGGYPFNLAYHSGVSMDQEASWVGLGWSLNPGAINRNMRGIPDDFKGEDISQEIDIKKNFNVAVNAGVNMELWSFDFMKGTEESGGSMSINLSMKYNSYRGFGMGLGSGISASVGEKDGVGANFGISLSLDSDEGAGFDANGGVSGPVKNGGNFNNSLGGGLSLGTNSRTGITNIGLNANWSKSGVMKSVNKLKNNGASQISKGIGSRSVGGTGTISFSQTAYTPSQAMEMKGKNVSGSVRIGGDGAGVFSDANIGVSYSDQEIKNKNITNKAYGYYYADKGINDSRGLNDINREKEGSINKFSSNLSVPSTTYDILSVQGQGVGGMYRPFRNDVGIFHDNYTESKFTGGGFGFDIGLGYPYHIGLSGDINHSESDNGKWQSSTAESNWDFTSTQENNNYENVYFRSLGEMTSENANRINEYIGGTKPQYIALSGNRTDPSISGEFNYDFRTAVTGMKNNTQRKNDSNRKPRNMPIQASLNSDINDFNLKEYTTVKYYTSPSTNYNSSNQVSYSRDNAKPNQFGGYTLYNADGSRYIYGIPAMNKVHKEVNFSVEADRNNCNSQKTISSVDGNFKPNYKVSGTEEYYSRKSIPEYAHAYLLTSILGHDYVDLTGDGPTSDDLGYWVKFNYVKTTSNYKWRSPYKSNEANWMKGHNIDVNDDKASYMYGEKETWYLATAETKTHIAVFEISQRNDARDAYSELSTSSNPGSGLSYKLDKIKLYNKDDYSLNSSNAIPLKTVFFEYSYKLCPHVPNNINSYTSGADADITGKLTLDKVYFSYENSTKNTQTPYEFTYSTFNPSYNQNANDRWGNYKPVNTGNECLNNDLPYTDQNLSKETRDEYSEAWNLKEIYLPSGAKMKITYEAKDYAYVQDLQAMQMTKIYSMADTTHKNWIYSDAAYGWKCDDPNERKIFFQLQVPIPTSTSSLSQKAEALKYVDDRKQLALKLLVYMQNRSEERCKEWVTGYVDIEDWGIDQNSSDGSNFTRGYLILKKPKVGKNEKDYHPFTLAALQKLKYDISKYAYNDIDNVTELSDDGAEQLGNALARMFGSFKELFSNYYKDKVGAGPSSKQWAARLDLDKSTIRLKNITGHKFGGGNRVAKIELVDNWNLSTGETNSSYGQVYDYSASDGKSSGVATYEPTIGGEEIPQRCYKPYYQKMSVNTFQNTYFEYPVNESYYPGPSIGYGRVSVSSLNTDKVIKNSGDYGFSTTGYTINEFYTAKDYPIITRETVLNPNLDDKNPAGDKNSTSMMYSSIPIPLPGFGSLSFNDFAASQGYSIELNDMHGKQKAVYNYGVDKEGHLTKSFLSSVEYKYYEETVDVIDPITNKTQTKKILKNNLPVLVSDIDPSDKTRALIDANRNIGIDYEFFTDMRESNSSNIGGGLSFNVELAYPIPFPFPWPNINYSESHTKVASTNKIIHRVGILKETIATDGQSKVSTNNICFDAMTGRPLLTTVTNDFDKPIYSYTIPAYWKYEGIGPAYKELDYVFKVQGGPTIGESGTPTYTNSSNIIADDGSSRNYFKVYSDYINDIEVLAEIYLENNSQKFVVVDKGPDFITLFYTGGTFDIIDDADYLFKVIRPGRRNHLTVDAGNITALKDPTKNRTIQYCQNQLPVYNSSGESSSSINCLDGADLKQFGAGIETLIAIQHSQGNRSYDFNDPVIRYAMNGVDYILNMLVPQGFISVTLIDNKIIFTRTDATTVELCFNSNISPVGSPVNLSSITSTITLISGSAPPSYSVSGYTYSGYTINGDVIALFIKNCNYLTPNTNNLSVSYPTFSYQQIVLDSVLSANASTYSKSWPQDFTDLRFPNGQAEKIGIVKIMDESTNGEKSIWRKLADFVYFTDREQVDNDKVTISRDGSYKLKIFDWFTESLNYLCDGLWVKVNETTRYNPNNNDTENKDALNNYSAALYSYLGKLPIAVAANTKYNEIGNENFEEYQVESNGNSFYLFNQFETSTGNLTFSPKLTTYTTTGGGTITKYRSIPFQYTVEGGSVIIISGDWPYDMPVSNVKVVIDKAYVSGGEAVYSPSRVQTVTINSIEDISDGGIPNANALILAAPINVESSGSYDNTPLFGHLEVPYEEVIPTTTTVSNTFLSQMTIVSSKAHTGRQSMLLQSDVSYLQDNLKLIYDKSKKYEFSCWMSRDNTKQITYKQNNSNPVLNLGVIIEGVDASGTVVYSSGLIQPTGNIINGWQKVEGSFTLNNANIKKIRISYKTGSSPVYVDDVRLFPYDSEMKSYVYDKKNYRYLSELDNNNYASFYYYDEEGNLFLVKKETSEGIKTIQESRTSIPLRP